MTTRRHRSPMLDHLQALLEKHAPETGGKLAGYIPELADANPDWFSICLATVDGHVHAVGCSDQSFTIQSISKPFVFGLALEDRGTNAVQAKVSVEPTGDAFNSISLEAVTGRPQNPMINAGAITASSLIAGQSEAQRRERLLGMFSALAGRSLSICERTYESERKTGHRNRAIGHMLRNFGILEDDPELALDLYFRQCSILVNCRDLAVMAATLACGGRNPVTDVSVMRPEYVGDVLSVMSTCGMYDAAGEWMYNVGLPAKSGVAGGLLAVVPGQMGIAVFSPPLDSRGNSVRGVKVCNDLARAFDLRSAGSIRQMALPIHSCGSLCGIRSKHVRPQWQQKILAEQGKLVAVCRLQGLMHIAAVERLLRELPNLTSGAEHVLLDFSRVSHMDQVANRLLLDARASYGENGQSLVFCGLEKHASFQALIGTESDGSLVSEDLDTALEQFEQALIQRFFSALPTGPVLELREHSLCQNMSEDEVKRLSGLVVEQTWRAGEHIVEKGSQANELYLIGSGEAGVYLTLGDGRRRRVATIPAGSAFGESAMVLGAVRSANVIADSDLKCWSLSRPSFEKLTQLDPRLKSILLSNLLRDLYQVSNRLTEAVATLESTPERWSGH